MRGGHFEFLKCPKSESEVEIFWAFQKILPICPKSENEVDFFWASWKKKNFRNAQKCVTKKFFLGISKNSKCPKSQKFFSLFGHLKKKNFF